MNKVEQHPGCESFCVYETTLKKSTDVNWRPEPQLCWQLDYSVQKSIHVKWWRQVRKLLKNRRIDYFIDTKKLRHRLLMWDFIFYSISLNWCYSYQVYNNLCNFSNSVNISERVRSELLLLILLHLHSTFERMLRIWFRKCQEKIISNTFYYLLDIMNRYV